MGKQAIQKAGYADTIRTIIYTGRPMRVLKTPYIMDWEQNRSTEIRELTGKGVLPVQHDLDEKKKAGTEFSFKDQLNITPLLMGAVAGTIEDEPTAKEIMDEMMTSAIAILKKNAQLVAKL